MSSEETQKTINKPTPLGALKPLRTVSAQATFNDTSNSTNEKTDLKLNINATVFVPKEKRSDGVKLDNVLKDNINSSQINSSQVNPSTTFVPQGNVNQQFQNHPNQFSNQNFQQKTSMVGYTYLNQGMYQPMPNPMAYTGYTPSPNKFPPTGNFFPGQYGIHPGNMYRPPYNPNNSNFIPPQINMPTTVTTNSNTVSNTSLTSNTSTTQDKKFLFNKDAQIFLPKSLRKEGEDKPLESQSNTKVVENASVEDKKETVATEIVIPTNTDNSQTTENLQKTENLVPVVITENVSTSEVVSQTEIVSEVDSNSQPEIAELKLAETTTNNEVSSSNEIKKTERPTKLKELFDAPSDKKNAALGPKNSTVKKNQTSTTTAGGVVVTNKAKQSSDLQKTLAEKSKLLQIKQKEEKNKPSYSPTPVLKKTGNIIIKINLELIKPIEREEPKREETPIPSDEEDEIPEPKKFKLENNYFLIEEKPISSQKEVKKYEYDINYMMAFSQWKICSENKLLGDMLNKHIEKMTKIWEDERPRGYKASLKDSKRQVGDKMNISRGTNVVEELPKDRNASFIRSSIVKVDPQMITTGDNQLGKWGRKDVSEAERLAKEFREKMEEERKKDPVRNQLIELLNILTVDNYEEVKSGIYELIKSKVEDQNKFLEVLFKKAVSEKAFVTLYAKIAKDLDRDMPQKTEKDNRISMMRSKLIDKCREIFKTEGNTKMDTFIKVTDPEEKEIKLKKFLLGNVNFIGELINAKLLSRKIVFQCIDNLFVRIEKADESDLSIVKLINLEGIVILIDKFGTLINLHDSKMKGSDEIYEFNNRIDNYLNRLNLTQESDKNLPGHIKYKIINLIEKRNRGWEESKVDKSTTAKGMKEVREEQENEQRAASSKTANKLDQELVNAKIKDDMYSWRDHIKNGYAMEEYNWQITESLIKRHKNSIAEILSGVGESCIDFIGKPDDIQYAYLYVREIIQYYAQKMEKNSKIEIQEVTLFFIQNMNDFSLDNNLLINVWGGIVYLLELHKIFNFYELEKLADSNEEQLKTIFEIVAIALTYYENKDEKFRQLNEINLVKSNQSLFQSIIDENIN